jgi:antitoxin (DNA-binding transcriptional repressor) of toxin-antitoxin stability system
MSLTLPIERAEQDLRGLIAQLNRGETVTLIGVEGVPVALLVSLRPMPRKNHEEAGWDARWDALARQASRAWKSENSVVELLTEMRR